MIIKDIIEGYFVLKDLKKRGYIEEDGLGLKQFMELVFNAEKNIRNRGDLDENKQS